MRKSSQQLLGVPNRSGHFYLQIYQRMRGLILIGAWRAGTRLPSSRTLARDLGVSRNTALLALEKLVADGWIEGRRGSGVYVSDEVPPVRPSARLASSKATGPVRSPRPIPFEIAHAATDVFPIGAWSKIQNRVWTESADEALHEGADSGSENLRREIAAYLMAVRGLACSPDQVLIMSSTQAAIDLTLRVLAREGDEIWVEDPGYPHSREAFQAHGLVQRAVPVDEEGLKVSTGREIAPNAAFAYLTPACQFPTCTLLSQDRRIELLDWASAHTAYVIEDDWDFNAVFDGRYPVEPLAAHDSERVLFIHAFNRFLFPALRVAALIVPLHLADRFAEARRAIDGFPNVPNQIALAEFLNQGLMSAHLRKCREVYGQRRAEMHEAVKTHLSPWITEIRPLGGLHAIVTLNRSPRF